MPLVFVAFALAPIILFDHFLGPGRDFVPFHDQIVVTDSQLNYSQTEKGAFIAVVGMIKNKFGSGVQCNHPPAGRASFPDTRSS